MAEPAATAHRPRFFFGWYIVGGSVLTNALLSAAYFQGFSALFLPIERHFGWNRSVISAAMSLRQLESGIVSPAVGFLLDRFSPRLIILVSAVLVSAGLIGLGLSNGIVMFFGSFVVVSLGASGASHAVTWPVVIARWFRRKRGIAMGLAVLGPIFGSPFVIVNTSLEESYGWRAVLVGWGLITLVLISLISAVARERPEAYGLRPDGDPAPSGGPGRLAAGSRGHDPGLRLHDVVRTRDFWLLMGYLGGVFAVNSGFQVHHIPYFVQDVGLSPQGAAVSLTLVFVISGIGRIGGGYLLDRSDYRVLLAGVAAMMGLSFVYLQLVDVGSVLGTMPFVVLFGVGLGVIIPLRGALGSVMFGTRSVGSVVGLLQGGAVAAGVAGPLFMGIVFDLSGSYRIAIWALVATSGLMVPVTLLMASPARLARRLSAAPTA